MHKIIPGIQFLYLDILSGFPFPHREIRSNFIKNLVYLTSFKLYDFADILLQGCVSDLLLIKKRV